MKESKDSLIGILLLNMEANTRTCGKSKRKCEKKNMGMVHNHVTSPGREAERGHRRLLGCGVSFLALFHLFNQLHVFALIQLYIISCLKLLEQ